MGIGVAHIEFQIVFKKVVLSDFSNQSEWNPASKSMLQQTGQYNPIQPICKLVRQPT